MLTARWFLDNCYTDKNGKPLIYWIEGDYYIWNGIRYLTIPEEIIRGELWKYLEPAQVEVKGKLEPYYPSRPRVGNVMEGFNSLCQIQGPLDKPFWTVDGIALPAEEMLPVKNGLLHFRSNSLIPPDPYYFSTSGIPVEFNPEAPEPKEWLKFLGQIFNDDQERIEVLQEWFGLLLTSITTYQKILLIVGPKRAGKGTITRIIKALLGGESICAPTFSSLSQNFGLSPLLGKKVAFVTDARSGPRADQSVIAERLLSISGEDPQTIDRKFRAPCTVNLSVRFVIFSNELPRIADASGALASRFIVLKLEQSFIGREDIGLYDRLAVELPGILIWALEGLHRLRKRGHLHQPAAAADSLEDLERTGSPVSAFVQDCCRVGPEHEISKKDLYRAWCDWCHENGRNKPGTDASFGRDLKAAVPTIKNAQHRINNMRPWFYQGITVSALGVSQGVTGDD